MPRTQTHGIRRHVDPASLLVIVLTLVLFVAALVVKGFGHDLLLEAGVFLVSVKLIIMAYKSSAATEVLSTELAGIRAALARLESRLEGSKSQDQRSGSQRPGSGLA